MSEILLIMGFGAMGALARFGITKWASGLFGTAFPYGTLIANVLGCFIIGVVLTAGPKLPIPKYLVTGMAVGFLGALTTFSSFGYATLALLKWGNLNPAVANIGLNVILGLTAVWLGVLTGRLIVG